MQVNNPILAGFNPDPSLVRAGDDYYIATSTFEWFPGVCIHHSKDLVNWEIISYALTDEQVLNLEGIDAAGGIWAPNLTYCEGVFYLLYTIVYTTHPRFKDTHNFLVTAESVQGPWSKPVALNRTGFDPSMFHDIDGRKWLVNMLLDYRMDHERFGGVLIQEYDTHLEKLVGPVYNIFQGSERGTTEGPNLFYHNGYYYLMVAEGGTSFEHCATLCRSRTIKGPYELCPNNPILTSSDENVLLQRAGHGQIIQGRDGNWYMAHLCSRTIDNCSIIGRETAIQNMELTSDGWFCLKTANGVYPSDSFDVPYEVVRKQNSYPAVDFNDGIPKDYMTLRRSAESCGIKLINGVLVISGGNSLSSRFSQGFLARRQQSFYYDFTAAMSFEPRSSRHLAGISCYYNNENYYYLCLTVDDDNVPCVEVITMNNKDLHENTRIKIPKMSKIFLRAQVRRESLQFQYSFDSINYMPVGGKLDMRLLSDERVSGHGFTGSMVGVTCQDLLGDGVTAKFYEINYIEFELKNII